MRRGAEEERVWKWYGRIRVRSGAEEELTASAAASACVGLGMLNATCTPGVTHCVHAIPGDMMSYVQHMRYAVPKIWDSVAHGRMWTMGSGSRGLATVLPRTSKK